MGKGNSGSPKEGRSVDLSSITVYADGRFQRYDDAKVGLLTHGLQYGTGCFEGIRGYWVPEERELFLVLLARPLRAADDLRKDPYDVASAHR